MPEIVLTQAEADALIAMEKHRVDEQQHSYPALGRSLRIPLASPDGRESFFLDISRGRIDVAKGTYQNRARHTVILVRLDFGGPPHRNPDGEEVPCPHLHVYREGSADKWATAVLPDAFADFSNLSEVLEAFMQFCNITQPPIIERSLFP